MELSWNNPKAVIELVQNIAERKGLGDILAEGVLKAAEKIGKDAGRYLLQVKGKCIPADVSMTPAAALGIVTSNSGTEYSKNRPETELFDLPEPILKKLYGEPVPFEGQLSADATDYTGKAWQVAWQENCRMAADCLGISSYTGIIDGYVCPSYEVWSKMLALATGLNMSPQAIWEAAERAIALERTISVREGLSGTEEALPESWYIRESAVPSPGVSIDATKLAAMVQEYYAHHGWNENGIPNEETVRNVSLG